jgi:hypothetical protein
MGHRSVASLALVLALFPAGSFAGSRAAMIRCTFVDPLSLAPTAFPGLSAEVRRIFADSGLSAALANGGSHRVEVSDELLLILLPRARVGRADETLGAVLGGLDGQGAAWLYWEPVAAALDLDPELWRSWSHSEKTAFSRALGRVAAHELIHIILPTFPHASAGLMRKSLSKGDLTRDGLELDGTVTAALHALSDTRMTLRFPRFPMLMPPTEQLRLDPEDDHQ